MQMLQNKNNASGKLFKREAAKESLLKRQFQKIAQSHAIMYTQKTNIAPYIPFVLQILQNITIIIIGEKSGAI